MGLVLNSVGDCSLAWPAPEDTLWAEWSSPLAMYMCRSGGQMEDATHLPALAPGQCPPFVPQTSTWYIVSGEDHSAQSVSSCTGQARLHSATLFLASPNFLP